MGAGMLAAASNRAAISTLTSRDIDLLRTVWFDATKAPFLFQEVARSPAAPYSRLPRLRPGCPPAGSPPDLAGTATPPARRPAVRRKFAQSAERRTEARARR